MLLSHTHWYPRSGNQFGLSSSITALEAALAASKIARPSSDSNLTFCSCLSFLTMAVSVSYIVVMGYCQAHMVKSCAPNTNSRDRELKNSIALPSPSLSDFNPANTR